MSVYIRRFTEDPGLDVLLDIESVNILDLNPSENITSVGTGTALLVAEFEDGNFNEPTEVFGPTDLRNTFGSFGYTYDGIQASNPCARKRYADSAVQPEYWNGNGAIALNGKKFKRLIVTRVDTSVGEVTFTRLASTHGTYNPTYNLEPSQTLVVETDLVAATTVTFSATAAVVTGVGGVFTGINAGDTLTLGYDGADNFTTTFQVGDTTIGAVVARINQYAGFTFASSSGGQLRLTGRQRGTGGNVRVVSGTTGLITAIGHSAGTTAGTGNVANIDAVTVAEVHALVHAAVAALYVTTDWDGAIVIYNSDTSGVAKVRATVATTATDFGFSLGTWGIQATAADDVTIPAGTRVRNAGGSEWVTMQSITAGSTAFTDWTVKIRPATDDGTATSALVSTLVVLPYAVRGAMFGVTNELPVNGALSELEIDNRYYTAIQSTVDLNSVAREANLIWAARQSNIVRRAMLENVVTASASGCLGRCTAIRPPLGTTRTVAKGTAEPGIQPYRNERVFYTYPGVQTYVPAIALRGTAGGAGFTADGVINTGADGFLMSVLSRLASEENPGQLTTFLDAVRGLESGTEYSGWVIDDYKSFKRYGIVAARMDDGVAIFQSGVTSVNPTTTPDRVRIARRRMADEIQDSLARIAKPYGKKTNRRERRNMLASAFTTYMTGLVSPDDPTKQRIEGFSIDVKTPNTPNVIASGAYYLVVRARTLSTLDAIVIQSEIGDTVTFSEV
jgi:hypothetical protein